MGKIDVEYKQVAVAGILYTDNRSYFLLSPTPVTPDWEDMFMRRFVVTPADPLGYMNVDDDVRFVYPYARHLLVNGANYSIEVLYANPILVQIIEIPEAPDDIDEPVTIIEDEHGNVIGVDRGEVYSEDVPEDVFDEYDIDFPF